MRLGDAARPPQSEPTLARRGSDDEIEEFESGLNKRMPEAN